MSEDKSPAEEMIRSTFTAPSLIGEGNDSPLLDRARDMVSQDFPNAEERKKTRSGKHKPGAKRFS
jgi:hypothetical protein